MKQELLDKFKLLLENDDVAAIKHDVRELRADFKAESAKEKQVQLEKWNQEEHEDGDEFTYVPSELDDSFGELIETYKARVKEYGQKIAEEQKANLVKKKALLEQMAALVQTEENIGKAFHDFNEILESWKSIGDVPGDKYEDINKEFTTLKEQFFYNINIYKALQENDLKVNLKKKEELIAKAKELASEKIIRNLEIGVRQLQKEWGEIGPSPRETYKEVGDEFFGELRKNYERIQSHYDSLKSEMADNLEKKKALVHEVKQLLELEITQHPTWVKKTEEVKALQEKWKSIGFAQKKDNENVWQEFRGLCDLFFEKKREAYKDKNEQLKKNQTLKEALIEQAKELQDSTDWRKTTDAFIKLQEKWKNTGATFQREEQKLWQKFRAACDTYFNAKKAFFKDVDAEQKGNLEDKKKVVEEIKAFTLTDDVKKDVAALKEFSARWNAIGFVPRKNMEELGNSYKAALDEKYKKLNVAREDASVSNYEVRVEALKNAPDAENQLRREKRILREKVDRLQQRVNQYENNIGFFGHSKGAESLRKDVEKKVESTHREIREIKKKLRLLD